MNNDDLKQIQENIHFIINNKGYGKKHFKRMQRLKKIKSFFHTFKKKELDHDQFYHRAYTGVFYNNHN